MLTGAQGTGKTTLARALAERLRREGRRTTLLQGIGRSVASRGLPLGNAATLDTVLAFAEAHLRREWTTRNRQTVVQDRCLLDLGAYARVCNVGPRVVALLDRLARISLSGAGTVVLYLPLTKDLPASLSPNEDDVFRRRIDRGLRETARSAQVRLERVEGPPQERVAQALRLLLGGTRTLHRR